jgi:hypothetical protein
MEEHCQNPTSKLLSLQVTNTFKNLILHFSCMLSINKKNLDDFDKKINVALKFWKQFCIKKLRTCVDNLFLGNQRTIFVAQHFDLLNLTILAHVSYTKLHFKKRSPSFEAFSQNIYIGTNFWGTKREHQTTLLHLDIIFIISSSFFYKGSK